MSVVRFHCVVVHVDAGRQTDSNALSSSSKDKMIVGSGKPAGTVRQETIAVSVTIPIRVPSLRLSPLAPSPEQL